jgi:hypothetical protein
MDNRDRERYAAVYRLLAEILERDRSGEEHEGQLSHALGNLARRIFVGAEYDPPDELLEQAAEVIRLGDPALAPDLARRLRRNADLLDSASTDIGENTNPLR